MNKDLTKCIEAGKEMRALLYYEAQEQRGKQILEAWDAALAELDKDPGVSEEPVAAWMGEDGRVCTARAKVNMPATVCETYHIPLYARPALDQIMEVVKEWRWDKNGLSTHMNMDDLRTRLSKLITKP